MPVLPSHMAKPCSTKIPKPDHRPVAGARESGDHAQIHQLRRCGGPRGGRCRLVRPAKGLSHGKEDQSDRYEDRQAESQGCRVHRLGHPPCRVRGPDQAVGAEELRVSPPRGRPIAEVHVWTGGARERRRGPARMPGGLGQDAFGGAGGRRRQRAGSIVPGLRRGIVESGVL